MKSDAIDMNFLSFFSFLSVGLKKTRPHRVKQSWTIL